MDYFAGIDASLETTNVCIVDGKGAVVLKQKVEAEPKKIVALLKRFGKPLKRIGLKRRRHGCSASCEPPAIRHCVWSAGM